MAGVGSVAPRENDPVSTDEKSGAAEAAQSEARVWVAIAESGPADWDDVPPVEGEVVVFYDPTEDLATRASSWGHRLPDASLWSLASFGAGLAMAEAQAWEQDKPHVATRAFADRRFLLGDRILHWAVPWLDTAGRCYPEYRNTAHTGRELLLRLGDRLRPAPNVGATEGLTPPGEDAFGPLTLDVPLGDWVRSLWSGAVILDATVRSLIGGSGELDLTGPGRADVAMLFSVAAARWTTMATGHPGSARLWHDLSSRADATAARLDASL
jgi:hypothetical protein